MRTLRHKNTVYLEDVLTTSKKVFIIMELVTGGELFDEILRCKGFKEIRARFYFRQLIEGLEYCHKTGFCHRDLKPENLLLDHNHVLKISDFGLSTLIHVDSNNEAKTTNSSTLYTQCGTPNYIAPEIIAVTTNGDGYSGAKVDLWTCGIILFVMVAGYFPFDADEADTLFKLISFSQFSFPPFFSETLKGLITNLLKTDPDQRYNLEDVKSHPWFNGEAECPSVPPLNPCVPSPSSPPRPPSSPPRSHRAATRSNQPANNLHKASSNTLRSDSLDLGMRTDFIESNLVVPPMAPLDKLSSQIYVPPPDAFQPEQAQSIANDSESTISNLSLPETPYVANGGHAHSNFESIRTRHGEMASDDSSFASSEDEHHSEFGDLEDVRSSDDFYHADSRETDGGSGFVRSGLTMHGDSFSGTLEAAEGGVSRSKALGSMVACNQTVRSRVRAQLWMQDRRALYFGSNNSNGMRKNMQRTGGNAACSGVNGIGDMYGGRCRDLRPGAIGKRRGMRRWDTFVGVSGNTDVGVCENDGSGNVLTRAHSFHGLMNVGHTRQKRRELMWQQPLVQMSEDVEGGGCVNMKNEGMQNGGCNKKDVRSRAVPPTPILRSGRRNDTLLRIKYENEMGSRRESSAMVSESTWRLDMVYWCYLMKDFDMIPDEIAFQKDMKTLWDTWEKGLAKEQFERKTSFAARRFGSTSFIGSRFTKAFSPPAPAPFPARTTERKREGGVVKTVGFCDSVGSNDASRMKIESECSGNNVPSCTKRCDGGTEEKNEMESDDVEATIRSVTFEDAAMDVGINESMETTRDLDRPRSTYEHDISRDCCQVPLHPPMRNAKSLRRLFKKDYMRLKVRSSTQFHTLLCATECAQVVLRLLRDYGCTILKERERANGEQVKIKCQVEKNGKVVYTRVFVYMLDEKLCTVLFKRVGGTGAVSNNIFQQLYMHVFKEYSKMARAASHDRWHCNYN